MAQYPLGAVTLGPCGSTRAMSSASVRSLRGVEVPWALTWSTSAGDSPACVSAARRAASAYSPPGDGAVGSWASEVRPAPARCAYPRRPRAAASAVRSSTSTAAPSAMTKPSRSAANGLEALGGGGHEHGVHGSAARHDQGAAPGFEGELAGGHPRTGPAPLADPGAAVHPDCRARQDHFGRGGGEEQMCWTAGPTASPQLKGAREESLWPLGRRGVAPRVEFGTAVSRSGARPSGSSRSRPRWWC